MKGILCGSSLILLLTTVCAASSPGDSANGKRLFANCTGCHDTSVFTRQDRQNANTPTGIRTMLQKSRVAMPGPRFARTACIALRLKKT